MVAKSIYEAEAAPPRPPRFMLPKRRSEPPDFLRESFECWLLTGDICDGGITCRDKVGEKLVTRGARGLALSVRPSVGRSVSRSVGRSENDRRTSKKGNDLDSARVKLAGWPAIAYSLFLRLSWPLTISLY